VAEIDARAVVLSTEILVPSATICAVVKAEIAAVVKLAIWVVVKVAICAVVSDVELLTMVELTEVPYEAKLPDIAISF